MRNLWIVLVLLAAVVGAQTIATRPTLSAENYRVLVLTPNGPVAAKIGAGITITAAPGEIIISAQQSAAAPLAHRFLTMDASSRVITASGCAIIFRNGVALLEGAAADYTRTSVGVKVSDKMLLDPAIDQWSGLCQ